MPAQDSLELDRYIEEVLGSLLEDDQGSLTLPAITDENILDAFDDSHVSLTDLPSAADLSRGGGGGGGGGGGEEGGGGGGGEEGEGGGGL